MATVRKRVWASGGVQREAWIADYFDANAKRRLKTFKRKKDADAWLARTQHELGEGIHTPASTSKTVAELGTDWLAHCEREGHEKSTRRQRGQHLDLHICPFLGREKLADLTAPMIHRFVDQLRDGGRSLAMRRKVLTSLKTMLTYAQGRGMVAQNVARGVRIKADTRAETDHIVQSGTTMPTKDEMRQMLDAATAPRWRAFMAVAIFTGLRSSELRGLRWDDVDIDAGRLSVRQRADFEGNIGRVKSKAGARDVPLMPLVVNALRTWKLTCPMGDADLVFPNKLGKPALHSNIIRRFFGPLQVRLGISNPTGKVDDEGEPIIRARYGLHALRHGAASLFIEQGWSPKKVQTVMGHSSITMTFDRYGHLFADPDEGEAMKRMEAAFLATG